eukprot:SAG31_NODE_1115_length_9839_cov_39.294661_1_plen_164_part_00
MPESTESDRPLRTEQARRRAQRRVGRGGWPPCLLLSRSLGAEEVGEREMAGAHHDGGGERDGWGWLRERWLGLAEREMAGRQSRRGGARKVVLLRGYCFWFGTAFGSQVVLLRGYYRGSTAGLVLKGGAIERYAIQLMFRSINRAAAVTAAGLLIERKRAGCF